MFDLCEPSPTPRGAARTLVALTATAVLLAGCGPVTAEPAPTPAPPPAEEPAPRERPDSSVVGADTLPAEPPPPVEPEPEPEPEEPPEPEPEERPEPEPEEPEVEAPEEAGREEAEEADRAFRPLVTGPVRRPASPVPVLPGAVLPRQRIVAFYGHANSTRMGILGELPPDRMLERLDEEVRRWEAADPATPVRPALHVIATMATGDPGPDGKYRLRMPSSLIDRVLEWASRRDALVFLDIQPGLGDVADELPRLERWLRLPHVHLGLDPEWNMPPGGVPGKQIGTMDAGEVNVAVDYLANLVEKHDLPPKVLVVHRFTQHMLPDPEDIETDPRVQLVVNMDGWGPPAQKLNTYRRIVAPEIHQWAGFKLFYRNDRWGGNRMLTPEELVRLWPVPVYIQYQ